mgnify:CR=1 FL=1
MGTGLGGVDDIAAEEVHVGQIVVVLMAPVVLDPLLGKTRRL